jgi:hypothetical protein
MSITRIAWAVGYEQDIHVVAGQKTRTLNDVLYIFDSTTPTKGRLANAYIGQAHPTVSLTFNGLFKGAPNALGIHVDDKTGQVSVDAALPAVRKNNFIIEVTVTDSKDGSTASETIRVHVHESVISVALTPAAMTIRPSTAKRSQPEPTSYRFTVRATFKDNKDKTMGDLTTGHGVSWSPSANVDSDGRIILATSNKVGDPINITATLPGGASKSAKVTVGQPWSAEPSMPKASIIPGGGWPGTTLPEVAPNILIMGDGFAAGDADSFEKIATELVHFIKTDKVVRPFDLLCTSMNFWCVMVPSAQRGISVRCEVYPVDGDHVRPVPRAMKPPKPPGSDKWDITNLIYAVGLPVPDDMVGSKAADTLRKEWAALVPVAPPADKVDDDLIAEWQNLGKRGFIDEIDGFPGMCYGAPPAANLGTGIPMLNLHDGRVGRTGLKSFFTTLASDNNVMVGMRNIGTVWAERGLGTFTFDNTDLIVMISAHPGGRAANYTGYIAMATKGGVFDISATPVPGGSNFQLNFTTAPTDVDDDSSRTMTHELGHSFGLDDEYVERGFDKADYPLATSDLAPYANLQRLDDVLDASQKIDGSLIRWNWRRVRKAAVVAGAPKNGSAPGSFVIPVVLGQGLQFQANDVLLLRNRTPGVVIDFPAKVIELSLQNAVQVLSRSADSVVVTRTANTTVTLADLQAFPPGSTLFLPVPMPKGMPQPTEIYARMVAKNVEKLITSTHEALYTRPADLIEDEDEQHPKLDNLSPSVPGRPFCFKVKPSIVGLYEGGARYAHKIFHPTGASCMMRNNHEDGAPFCAVCRYIMVELINPFEHFTIDLDYDDIYPLR